MVASVKFIFIDIFIDILIDIVIDIFIDMFIDIFRDKGASFCQCTSQTSFQEKPRFVSSFNSGFL